MGELATKPNCRLSLRQGVQVMFVAALGLALTGSLATRGLPLSDILLGALVTLLASGHVYALLWRENRARRLIAASQEVARLARADSERSAREKHEFMANVGHELGAPLAAIVGFAEVLRAGDDRTPAERHEVIETILRSGRRLLNMTSDMLDLSRLEAGRLTVQRTGDCAPPAIIAEVETLMRPLAAQRGLRFRIARAGPLPVQIHSDPARLRQILVNLSTHALRAAERGEAVVTISAREGDRASLVMEAPAGRGVGALERLLGQGDSPASGRFDSVRLGLVIAQRLAVLLGGGLEVAPGASGRRAILRASVETGPLEGVEMAAEPEKGRPARDAHPRAALPAPVELDARILLVDEDGDDHRLIASHLRHAGAEVETEPGAREAADRAMAALRAGRPFDLLVVDGQDEHLAQVRRLRRQGYTEPIVALAPSAELASRDACLQAGCNQFVESPVSRAGIIEPCARAARRDDDGGRPRATEAA